MPHRLRVVQKDDIPLHATLKIVKPRRTQAIEFDFPIGIDLDRFYRSWKEQQCNWIEISQDERDGIFTAIRLILIHDSNMAILWRVMHFRAKPYDAAEIVEFTPELMATVRAMR